MARIQYRPSAQRKGFNPNKLSTEGISRMREESSRIVQGLRETRAAEAKQAAINLRAMESDAAYTERITKENYAIEQQNLQNRQNQILADIQGQQQQAQTDSEDIGDEELLDVKRVPTVIWQSKCLRYKNR